MDYITELHKIQDWFEDNSIHCFSFKLEIDNDEISFEYDIRIGFEWVETYNTSFNACDRKLNLNGLERKIKEINYLQYKIIK